MITGSPTLHMRLPSLCMQALGLGYSTVWANRAGSQSTHKLRRERLASGRDGFPSERDIVPTPPHNASMFGIIQGRRFIAPNSRRRIDGVVDAIGMIGALKPRPTG